MREIYLLTCSFKPSLFLIKFSDHVENNYLLFIHTDYKDSANLYIDLLMFNSSVMHDNFKCDRYAKSRLVSS